MAQAELASANARYWSVWETALRLQLRAMPQSPMDPRGFDRQASVDSHVLRLTDFLHPRILESPSLVVRLLAGSGLGLLARQDPKAVPLFERIVQLYRELGETSSRRYWTACSNLTAAYRLDLQLEQAVRLDTAAVESLVTQFGDDDLDTISARNNLATSLWRLGRFDRAIAIQTDVVSRRSRHEGASAPSVLRAKANLAVSLLSSGSVEDAIALFEPLVEATALASDPTFDSDGLTLRMNLGAAYFESNRFAEARELLEPIAAELEYTLGPLHPHTLTAQSNLAASLLGLGNHMPEALGILRRVHAGRLEGLGENHPDTLDTAHLIGDLEPLTGAQPVIEPTI